jgi:dsRNA-specific ribonuclease
MAEIPIDKRIISIINSVQNSKNILQEIYQRTAKPLPKYETKISVDGSFICTVSLCTGEKFTSVAKTRKKDSEFDCAQMAIDHLKETNAEKQKNAEKEKQKEPEKNPEIVVMIDLENVSKPSDINAIIELHYSAV